jgi:GT2 family glycosyltransferase
MSSLQIQSVLYNNTKTALFRSLDSLECTIKNSLLNGGEFNSITVCYGDASQTAIFSDEEMAVLTSKYKDVFSLQYTYFNCNTGTSKGHNMLGRDCETDYMMIMNPDVLLSPKFMIEIMKPFQNKQLNTGLVEARQTPVEHPKEYDVTTGETCWAATACAIFPTEIFHKLKGFDENSFFMYCDDVDFSWRIRLLGKKIIYQPLATIFHAKRLSSSGNWQPTPAEIYYSSEANLVMSYKWSNTKLLQKTIENFLSSKNEILIKAVRSFEHKRHNNLLPAPIDKNRKVATFKDGNYAIHRFIF